MKTSIALLALLACRTPVAVSTDSEVQERPRPAPPVSAAAPAPVPEPEPACPEALRSQSSLEALLGESLRPGAFHPDSQPSTLGFGDAWAHGGRATVAPRNVELAALSTPSIGVLAAFVRHGEGVCVVNTWTTYFPANLRAFELVDTWGAPGVAIALVRVTLKTGERSWVVLGSDGARLWFALEERGMHQLPVRDLALRPAGSKLYLEVTNRQTTRFVLRGNGVFERLGP